jgi:hypothetical protein
MSWAESGRCSTTRPPKTLRSRCSALRSEWRTCGTGESRTSKSRCLPKRKSYPKGSPRPTTRKQGGRCRPGCSRSSRSRRSAVEPFLSLPASPLSPSLSSLSQPLLSLSPPLLSLSQPLLSLSQPLLSLSPPLLSLSQPLLSLSASPLSLSLSSLFADRAGGGRRCRRRGYGWSC